MRQLSNTQQSAINQNVDKLLRIVLHYNTGALYINNYAIEQEMLCISS